ncbi:MAG TPA: hypothetical protein VFK04_12905 [Gemmatimonadaceae bacterium]|nr:hypothetical protein [Gemmatimonadaceae bacterium]
MAERELTQVEISEWLDLTTRRVRDLVKEGLPSRVEKGKRLYLWPAALHWYIRYKVEAERKQRPNGDSESIAELHRREKMADVEKAEADAEIRKLELARQRAITMTVDDAARELEHILGGMNSALGNFSGRWAPELVALPDTRAVRALLDKAIAELRELLTAAGDTDAPEPEPGDDADEQLDEERERAVA